MDIPTGPRIVGHEEYVLPSRVGVSRRIGETRVTFTAPRCRYGPAMYQAIARCPTFDREGRRYPPRFCIARGGSKATLTVSPSWPDFSVTLRLRSFILKPGAFDRFTDDELIAALSHELSDVREAAFLAIQRPRPK